MTRLVCTPLGSSARDSFCTELEHLDYGEGVLILPNGLLMDDVQKKAGYNALAWIPWLAESLI